MLPGDSADAPVGSVTTTPGIGVTQDTTGAGTAIAAPQSADSMLGREVLGQYRITAKIGQGGMGAVYRAWQAAVGRDVVVKVLHPWLSADPDVAARFQAEARAAALLQSPHIVAIFNFGQLDDGTLFLAMEHLAGRSLADALVQEGRFALHRTVDVMRQCCAALGEAHRKHVVHRDFKPSNIMLLPHAGGSDLVKVLDFGIAKVEGSGGLTREGAMLGTPRYMSPEQVQGQATDARADVYALGLVTYEMLAGRPAFTAADPVGYLHQHLNVQARPLREVVPEAQIPPSVEACVQRALAKDPAVRTPSADAFAAELAAALADPTATPAVDNAKASTGTAIAAALGGALFVAAGIGGAAAFGVFDGDQPAPVVAPDEPQAEPKPEEPIDPVNYSTLTPEQEALLAKSIPELEEELRRVVAAVYPPGSRQAALRQLEASHATPPGLDPAKYRKFVLVRTIASLRGSIEMSKSMIAAPEESAEELENRFYEMDCSMTASARRHMVAQIRLNLPDMEIADVLLRKNLAEYIKVCEQNPGTDPPPR